MRKKSKNLSFAPPDSFTGGEISTRKRAEKKLHERDAELREAQRVGGIGSWSWNAVTDVTLGSDELLRIYGFNPETDSMPNFVDQDGWLYPPESWRQINEAVKKSLETGEGYKLEIPAFRSRSEPIWVTTRSEVVRDTDGKIIGLRGTVQDITERKRREINQQFIIDLDKRLGNLSEPGEIEQAAIEALGEFLRVSRCYFAHVDKNERAIIEREFRAPNLAVSMIAEHHLQDYLSPAGIRGFLGGETIVSNNIDADARTTTGADGFSALQICAFVAAPVFYQGEWNGILNITASSPRQWREDELELVRETAARIYPLIERARSERALRESKARFDIVKDSAQVGFWFCDLPFDKLIWDNRVKEHFWLPPEAEVTIDTFYEQLHPDDRERTRQAINESIAKKNQYEIEYRTVAADKQEKWIRAVGRTFYDNLGNPIRFDGVTLDITEHKQADDALHASRQKLEIALKAGKMGSWTLDLTTGELASSDTCKINYGRLPTDEFTYQDLAEAVLPEDFPHWRETVKQAIEKCSEFEIEYRVVWLDGSIHWVLVRGNGFADKTGKTVLLAGVSIDVTAGKQADKALRESQKFNELIIESAPTLLYVYDLIAQKNIFLSPQIFSMLGWTKEEITAVGSDLFGELFHPDDLMKIAAHHEQIQAAGTEEIFAAEYRIRHKSGEWRWLCSRDMIFKRDDNGRPTQILGTAEDITESKKAEAERERLLKREQELRRAAETANRLKDEFLATVSHELRTPLNAILGWASMLQTGRANDDMRRRAVETIYRSAQSQAQLIEDLLDTSRIISGNLRIQSFPVNLASVIEKSIETLRPAADAKSIELKFSIEIKSCLISGDVQRLQQIVWNLVSNAVKFTPDGGTVAVRLESVNSCARVTVQDTGKGIEAEFLPYIFERFRQEDASTTRRHGGLGLGLAIVRNLTELHGGTISAFSAGLNQGAIFTLEIPLLSAAVAGSEILKTKPETLQNNQKTDETQPAKLLDGVRILLVDDELDTLELLDAVLSNEGASVRVADSASEAFEIFQDWQPDVLISDIGMPGEDGYSLIKKVRELPSNKGGITSAIAMTAYGRDEDQRRVLASGFHQYIAKPAEPFALITVINNLTGKHRR